MSPDINRVFVSVSVFPWVVATPEGGLKYTQVLFRDHMEELPWRFRRGTRCEGYAFCVGIHGLEFIELVSEKGSWVRSIMRVRGYVISVER